MDTTTKRAVKVLRAIGQRKLASDLVRCAQIHYPSLSNGKDAELVRRAMEQATEYLKSQRHAKVQVGFKEHPDGVRALNIDSKNVATNLNKLFSKLGMKKRKLRLRDYSGFDYVAPTPPSSFIRMKWTKFGTIEIDPWYR